MVIKNDFGLFGVVRNILSPEPEHSPQQPLEEFRQAYGGSTKNRLDNAEFEQGLDIPEEDDGVVLEHYVAAEMTYATVISAAVRSEYPESAQETDFSHNSVLFGTGTGDMRQSLGLVNLETGYTGESGLVQKEEFDALRTGRPYENMGSPEYFEDMKLLIRNSSQEETVELVEDAVQGAARAERAAAYANLEHPGGEQDFRESIHVSARGVTAALKDAVDILNNHYKNKDR